MFIVRLTRKPAPLTHSAVVPRSLYLPGQWQKLPALCSSWCWGLGKGEEGVGLGLQCITVLGTEV